MSAGGKGTGRAGEDVYVLSATMLVLFTMLGAELAAGPNDMYIEYYRPYIVVDEPNGGEGGDGGAPPTENVVLVSQDGSTDEGGTTEVPFELPYETTVEMTIVLTWTDDIGNNDELGLSIESGGKEKDSTQGTAGSLELRFDAPAQGNYTAVVSAVRCPGMVGPLPVDRDTGNTWSIEVRAVYEVGP